MPIEIIIVNIAYFLTFLALAIREIFWLRIVLTIAQFCHLSHAYMNLDFSKGGWTIIFVSLNIFQIFIIYRDRQAIAIPEEIQDLYKNIFHTKSNREFLHFWDQGKLHYKEKGSIIKKGDTQSDLMLILNGNAKVYRDEKEIAALERGQFIAEISYITGESASADVIIEDGLTYYVWNRKILDKLRKTKPATMEKLDRILTLDMAGKLTR